MPSRLVGVPGLGQDLQGLVQRADDPVQHPGGNHAGHDNQQTGEQPFAQSGHESCQRRRRPWRAAGAAGAGAAAGACGRRSRARLGFGSWGWSCPGCRHWKSVAYQPEPLSWKPAAVTCLEKASAPQAGQSVQRGIGDFLQHILGMAAGAAFVGINRHVSVLRERAKPSIIGGPSTYQPLRHGRRGEGVNGRCLRSG